MQPNTAAPTPLPPANSPPYPGLDHRHFDKIKQYLGETLQEMGVSQVGGLRGWVARLAAELQGWDRLPALPRDYDGCASLASTSPAHLSVQPELAVQPPAGSLSPSLMPASPCCLTAVCLTAASPPLLPFYSRRR